MLGVRNRSRHSTLKPKDLRAQGYPTSEEFEEIEEREVVVAEEENGGVSEGVFAVHGVLRG